MNSKGLFTRKSDFALGLQVYNASNIFLFSKMDQHTVKSCSKIRCVNKPKLPCEVLMPG